MSRVIGLLGGTFDPVHNAHVHLARVAIDAFGLDEVRFMPANVPPHKMRARLTPGAERAAMCRLACADDPRLAVETIELDRPGLSFTVDTLRALCGRDPCVTWRLIMGADMLAIFHTWKDVAEVIRLGHPIIAGRPGTALDAAGLRALLDPSLAGFARALAAGFLDLPPLDISSTGVRRLVAEGQSVHALVPPAVAEHIARTGLYRMPE